MTKHNEHTFKIQNKKAHIKWEKLIKCKINSDKVIVPHTFYIKNLEQIHFIQFGDIGYHILDRKYK